MGWTNSHLHQFEIGGERSGDPELLDDGFDDFECIDSTVTKLSEVVPKTGKRCRFKYEYDFGDCWEHEVTFEGCVKAEPDGRFPLCLEGARSCPPEDVGGVGGYEEFLEALADPEARTARRFRAMGWAVRSREIRSAGGDDADEAWLPGLEKGVVVKGLVLAIAVALMIGSAFAQDWPIVIQPPKRWRPPPPPHEPGLYHSHGPSPCSIIGERSIQASRASRQRRLFGLPGRQQAERLHGSINI